MKSTSFEPLSHALQNIHFWLSRNDASRLMVAASTITAMKRRGLPDHVTVTPQKRRGPRIALSSAHFVNRGQTTLAVWPEDGLSEYSIPLLAFVINGQADLRIADYVLHCQTGDAVFFPAGIPKCNSDKPHLTGDTRGRSCSVLWINPVAPLDGVCCNICHSRDSQHLSFREEAEESCISQNPFLKHLFEGLCEELQQRGPGRVAMELLPVIVYLLRRDIDEGAVLPHPYSSFPAHALAEECPDPISQVCSYIDSHLKLQLTIKSVARHAYLSPTIFTRRFREHTGQSFHEYLTAQRLEKAVSFLRETNIRVHEISNFVGIKPSRLRDLFRKKYGCSPAEFRRRYPPS